MDTINDKIIKAVKEKFNVTLKMDHQMGFIFPDEVSEGSVVQINQYCAKLRAEKKL